MISCLRPYVGRDSLFFKHGEEFDHGAHHQGRVWRRPNQRPSIWPTLITAAVEPMSRQSRRRSPSRAAARAKRPEPEAAHCSGSENFPWIENPVRIEGAFQRAHHVHLDWILHFRRRSRFITPMPCSAEIDPPYFATILCTSAFTSSQRARKFFAVGADRLADIVVDVAVAHMAERNRAARRE